MNWQILKSKFWWLAVIAFGLHQLLEKGMNRSIPVLDNYLDPLLSMPILLGLILQERQLFLNRYVSGYRKNYRFTALETGTITLFFAIIFEEIFPGLSPYFTRDWLDYIAYFVGAVYFYYLINQPSAPR